MEHFLPEAQNIIAARIEMDLVYRYGSVHIGDCFFIFYFNIDVYLF